MRLTPEKKRLLFSCLTPLKFARSPIEGRGDRACIIPKAMPRFAILLGCCACSLRVLALTPPQPAQLSCKVRGFYPFAGGPRGPVAWLFRDTHQALSVVGEDKARLHMDFMTEGGPAHPVWWDEGVKWKVLLGQSIQGEVRIRSGGRGGLRLVEGVGVGGAAPGASASSKLERLREIAEAYDCRMNLYSNNCRIFCARMRRAVLTPTVPGPPCCTYGRRVPASCVTYVPEAQGSLPWVRGTTVCRRTRTSLGRAARPGTSHVPRAAWCTTGGGRRSVSTRRT